MSSDQNPTGGTSDTRFELKTVTMSADQNSSGSSGNETWDTNWADFVLETETGEELMCHKTVLVKCSPFFKAMLSFDCEETKNNRMKVKDFSVEVVVTFLEYHYAEYERIPEQDVYKRKFDKTRITPQLMKMCHMYQVESLHQECLKYLMENISDANAVGTWIEAERCESKDLKHLAIKHIAKKKEHIHSIPGMDETYQCPELMKSMVEFLSSRSAEDFFEKSIKVMVKHKKQKVAVEVYIKPSDTVMALKDAYVLARWKEGTNTKRGFLAVDENGIELEDNRTLESYNIKEKAVITTKNI